MKGGTPLTVRAQFHNVSVGGGSTTPPQGLQSINAFTRSRQDTLLKRRWSRGDLQFFLEVLANIPETILGH